MATCEYKPLTCLQLAKKKKKKKKENNGNKTEILV